MRELALVTEKQWSVYGHIYDVLEKKCGLLSAHRTDVLAHALVYYGMKTKAKLGVQHYIHVYC